VTLSSLEDQIRDHKAYIELVLSHGGEDCYNAFFEHYQSVIKETNNKIKHLEEQWQILKASKDKSST